MVVDALSRKMISILSLKHCAWRFVYDGALLAQLRVMLEFWQMMIDAQKNDVQLQQRVQLVRNGDKIDYSCDAPKPEGPLITHQPAKNLWIIK